MQFAHLLPSPSWVESGSSFLLVSGRRKTKTPLTTIRLLKTMMGMDQWYLANVLHVGDSRLATLMAMEPKPTAACLFQGGVHLQMCTVHKYVWILLFCVPDRGGKQLLNVDHTY